MYHQQAEKRCARCPPSPGSSCPGARCSMFNQIRPTRPTDPKDISFIFNAYWHLRCMPLLFKLTTTGIIGQPYHGIDIDRTGMPLPVVVDQDFLDGLPSTDWSCHHSQHHPTQKCTPPCRLPAFHRRSPAREMIDRKIDGNDQTLQCTWPAPAMPFKGACTCAITNDPAEHQPASQHDRSDWRPVHIYYMYVPSPCTDQPTEQNRTEHDHRQKCTSPRPAGRTRAEHPIIPISRPTAYIGPVKARFVGQHVPTVARSVPAKRCLAQVQAFMAEKEMLNAVEDRKDQFPPHHLFYCSIIHYSQDVRRSPTSWHIEEQVTKAYSISVQR